MQGEELEALWIEAKCSSHPEFPRQPVCAALPAVLSMLHIPGRQKQPAALLVFLPPHILGEICLYAALD